LSHEPFEPRPILFVVAVTEQDDAVGLAAVFVVLLPVVRELLKLIE